MKKYHSFFVAVMSLFFMAAAQPAVASPDSADGTNGDGEAPVYTIECLDFQGGVVVPDTLLGRPGDIVTFTAIPNANYYFTGSLTLEMTIDGIDVQGREFIQSRAAIMTTEEVPMTLDAATGFYTGTFTMVNSNVRVISATFLAKRAQVIKAEDIVAYEDAADLFVAAENTTEGGGALSYSVSSGNDVVEVDAETGALTILGSGSASIVVSAAETELYRKTSVTVTVTIKELPKRSLNIVSGMATFYDADYSFVIPEGVQAWTGVVNYDEEAIIMTELSDVIPAGTPVLITSESLTSVTMTADVYGEYIPVESDLKGTNTFYGNVTSAGNIFVLHYGVFIRAASGVLPSGKAYVVYNNRENNARLTIRFDNDGETAVSSLKAAEKAGKNAHIYDLQGRRLSKKPASGYYIQNGKICFVVK